MKKRKAPSLLSPLTLLLSLFLLAACLTGCAGGGDPVDASPGGTESTPPHDPTTTPGGGDPAGGVEGSLFDILDRLYAIYVARDDVKNAQAELDELNPQLFDLDASIGELMDKQFDPDISDSEREQVEAEIADLEAQIQPLRERANQLYAILIDPATMENQALTEEGTEFNPNIEYFLGAKGIPFIEGVSSEPAMSAAYSLVLLRMEPGADIEAAKKTIKDNVDPSKWICAIVDPSDVIVDNIGDLVILIMADNSKELHEAFLQLAD
ncbi:MAG: hypothetical protein FWE59_06105 [Oscillospiraceae bacterium]|nr:hypothetical protein [Oscillospiraceae bacterium]